jgi:hypothetical protein
VEMVETRERAAFQDLDESEERAHSFREGISPCACPYAGTVDGISAVDNYAAATFCMTFM